MQIQFEFNKITIIWTWQARLLYNFLCNKVYECLEMQIMTLLEMIWKTLLIKNYIKHYINEMKNYTI